nr:leucine-rich repeat domain-containing protein [Treponema sp.]
MADIFVIEDGVLEECTDKSATSVEIPDGVEEIDEWAFSDCASLTSVEIPSSVTKIGETAFVGCESLLSVEFGGTVAQWKAVRKGSDWHNGVPATSVKCADGEAEL